MKNHQNYWYKETQKLIELSAPRYGGK